MPLATHEADAMVAFVGAGPGDPELLTLKAQRLIAKADVLIYADSLVSPDVCQYAKPGAAIYGSAALTLEAIIDIMLKAVAHGQFVVRLQSGDPGLYGAVYEQQRLLDRHGISYIVVPGVSSVFAAAAAVGAELTVPEVAQSLILTRQAGRVPMPERESLRSLASHTTTLCIFLSITRVRQVVEELLAGGYTPQTPAVVVYRATWPDQKIIRSTLATLVQDVKQARISRQALIMVGWAFAPAQGDESELKHRSHLYLPEYKHLFRGGIAIDEDASGICAEQAERHGDRKGSGLPADLMATASHPHGDRKGPPNPTQPPSPLLYTGLAAPASYSSGEGGAMGMGGPLRSPCGCAEQADHTATKRIALVVLTRAGLALALRLQPDLGADVHIYASPRAWKTLDAIADQAEVLPQTGDSGREQRSITRFETVAPLLSQIWTTYDQIVLFLALGAVVRLIAPLLHHKHEDPGIVAIDDAGRFAISVVSGHIGDANGLATRCAALLGATPVVTTASDVHNTLAADMLAHTQGWQVEDSSAMTAVSAAIVNGEAVAVLQDCGGAQSLSPRQGDRDTCPPCRVPCLGDRDPTWWGNERPWPGNLIHVTSHQEVSATHFAALLVIADRLIEGLPRDVPTLVYRPPTLVLGIGCRRGVSFSTLDTFVKETLAEQRVAFQSIALLATADIKADEAALQMLVQRYGWSFETHAVTALKTMTEVPNPSERVRRLVGTPSVCEAAALLSSNGGELIVPKQKGEGITIAVARLASTICSEQAEGR